MKNIIIFAALVISIDCLAEPLSFEKVYVDNHKNVHIVTSAAKDINPAIQ